MPCYCATGINTSPACQWENEERCSDSDARLSSRTSDRVSVCLASVPQDVKYAPICYPRLALDSLSGEDLDAVAYFGALSHFPGFLLTLEGEKKCWLFITDQFWFV